MSNLSFGKIVLVYYVMGVVVWFGGVAAAQPGGSVGIGIAGEVVDVNDSTGEVEPNKDTGRSLRNLGGPLRQAAGFFGGGAVLAVWSFIKALVGTIFWPIHMANAVGAPGSVIALSGALSAAFLTATIVLVRGLI